MKLHTKFKRSTLTMLVLAFALQLFAVDATYYTTLDGKSASDLRVALTTLTTTKHTSPLSYDWTFDGIDIVNGTVLDMYSTCSWTAITDQCGTYVNVCDCYNREHTVPQSLFNEVSPQRNDRHHLFLTDGKVNGQRSNYPFGECASGASAGAGALGRLGNSTFTDYTSVGTVFEPDNAYKGDIARAVMYMAIRYATVSSYPVTSWSANAMFSGSLATNFGLSDYAVALFLKWHREDPVSQKEIDRNSGVETKQGNRNPFVDYPCLAEYLWGNSKDATVTLSSLCGSFEAGFVAGSSLGCSSCSSGSIPTVTLPTYSEGSAGGNITSLGDPATLTENGIYYSTTSGFANGAGTKLAASTTATTTGTFSVDVSTLPEGTYYFKAFATNSVGTGYSSQSSFTIVDPEQAASGPNLVMGTLVTNDITFGTATSKELFIKISNVASDITITLNNNNGNYKFSAGNTTTITLTAAEAAAGKKITLTRNSGNNGATLTLSGSGVNKSHNIKGN